MSNRELLSNLPEFRELSRAVPVSRGGFGSSDPFTAVKNIDGIHKSEVNKAKGLIMANLDNMTIKPEQISSQLAPSPTIRGPNTATVGSSVQFTITNYSPFQSYAISADSGTVTRSGNIITYIAPTGGGVHSFKVNNREYFVTVSGAMVNKPIILTPIDNAVNQGPDVTVTSSAFGVIGTSDTHLGTDWQVADEITFTNPLSLSVVNDQVNKTSWTFQAPDPSSVYFIRCRHKGTAIGYSGWSDPIRITTKAVFMPTVEMAKIFPTDGLISDHFGSRVTMSGDGNVIAIAAPDIDVGGVVNCGAVYVYNRSGSTFIFKAKLTASDKSPDDNFGISLKLNENGTVLAVGAPNNDASGINNAGAVYVFKQTSGTWSQITKLTAADLSSASYLGSAVAINAAGTVIFAGAPGNNSNGQVGAGAVYVFSANPNWTQTYKLFLANAPAASEFGGAIDLNSGGTVAAIGAPNQRVGTLDGSGVVYIFTFTTTWTQTGEITAASAQPGGRFGASVSITELGTSVLIGAPQMDDLGYGISDVGRAYLFTKNGSLWNESKQFVKPSPIFGDQYGNAVAINSTGDKIFVSSYQADTDSKQNSGNVDLFAKEGMSWVLKATNKASDGVANDFFGKDIAINKYGSRLIVGAHYRDNGATTDVGAVYVFA